MSVQSDVIALINDENDPLIYPKIKDKCMYFELKFYNIQSHLHLSSAYVMDYGCRNHCYISNGCKFFFNKTS